MSWFERAGAEILRLISRSSDPGGAASELQVFAKAAELYAQNASGDVYQYTPHLSSDVVPTTRTLLWQHACDSGGGVLRMYASTAGNGAFEITINASWNGSAWTRDVLAKAVKFAFGDADAGWHVKQSGVGTWNDASWDGKVEHALSDANNIVQDVAGAWTAPSEIDAYITQQCPKPSAGHADIGAGVSFKKDFPATPTSFTFTSHDQSNITGIAPAYSLSSFQPQPYGMGVRATPTAVAAGTTCYFYARIQVS